ncbi:MAG: hypothetical protein Q7I94_05765, partial [Candidatus Contubernalis sp.]|nr:hypothetical protein [Candidatus Contubernalis sp.]
AYLHVLSPCPPGWGISAEDSIQLARLAIETGIFPLFEIEKGRHRITNEVETLMPVERYLKKQGRFKRLSPEMIEMIQERVCKQWQELKEMSQDRTCDKPNTAADTILQESQGKTDAGKIFRVKAGAPA